LDGWGVRIQRHRFAGMPELGGKVRNRHALSDLHARVAERQTCGLAVLRMAMPRICLVAPWKRRRSAVRSFRRAGLQNLFHEPFRNRHPSPRCSRLSLPDPRAGPAHVDVTPLKLGDLTRSHSRLLENAEGEAPLGRSVGDDRRCRRLARGSGMSASRRGSLMRLSLAGSARSRDSRAPG
jgi:hypothetical protein